MSWYREINREKSYHRPIFLAAALGLASLCSFYPMMCFKNYSTKHKKKMAEKVADLERKQEEEEEWERTHRPRRTRHQSHSSPRTAHTPHHHRRRHSTARVPEFRDGKLYRYRDADEMEMSSRSRSSHRHPSNDREIDRERRYRHHGHPPPRRYHHSS